MQKQEKEMELQRLREREIELLAVMSESDSHASKCVKLGVSFRDEYPSEYEQYVSAREEYNANELRIAELEKPIEEDVEQLD